jgi:hypothetical protein
MLVIAGVAGHVGSVVAKGAPWSKKGAAPSSKLVAFPRAATRPTNSAGRHSWHDGPPLVLLT